MRSWECIIRPPSNDLVVIEWNILSWGAMTDSDGKLDYISEKLDDVSDTVCRIDKEVVAQKVAFDDHIKQDERMYEEFKRMNDILQANTDSLKEHMHRSDLLEKLVDSVDKRLNPLEVKEIQREAVRVWWKSKVVLWTKILGAVGGAVTLGMLIKAALILLIK